VREKSFVLIVSASWIIINAVCGYAPVGILLYGLLVPVSLSQIQRQPPRQQRITLVYELFETNTRE
jgi:hypothetical protein